MFTAAHVIVSTNRPFITNQRVGTVEAGERVVRLVVQTLVFEYASVVFQTCCYFCEHQQEYFSVLQSNALAAVAATTSAELEEYYRVAFQAAERLVTLERELYTGRLGVFVGIAGSTETEVRTVERSSMYAFHFLATVPLTCAVHADDIKRLPWLCNP